MGSCGPRLGMQKKGMTTPYLPTDAGGSPGGGGLSNQIKWILDRTVTPWKIINLEGKHEYSKREGLGGVIIPTNWGLRPASSKGGVVIAGIFKWIGKNQVRRPERKDELCGFVLGVAKGGGIDENEGMGVLWGDLCWH